MEAAVLTPVFGKVMKPRQIQLQDRQHLVFGQGGKCGIAGVRGRSLSD